jgi:predicted transposase YdaD
MNKEAFFSLVRTQLSPDVEEKIMTVSEQLRAEGMQQGMQQGMRLANLKTAREMLRQGMAETIIAGVIPLTIEEIRSEASKI